MPPRVPADTPPAAEEASEEEGVAVEDNDDDVDEASEEEAAPEAVPAGATPALSDAEDVEPPALFPGPPPSRAPLPEPYMAGRRAMVVCFSLSFSLYPFFFSPLLRN